MSQDMLFEETRRAVLKSAAVALGGAAVGTASGHPGGSKGYDGTVEEFQTERNPTEDAFSNAAAVGYHSLGGVGPASEAGRPEQVYSGNMAEMDAHGDVAVISFRVATEEDPGRRMAVVDISEFNEASTRAELDDAELTVLSYLRNQNAEMNWSTDVKLSGDGNYAFMGTQQLDQHPGQGSYEDAEPLAGVQTLGGVVAVDITDPENPATVGSLTEPFTTGIHNLVHHRIDGVDYVFACKDAGLIAPDSGVYIIRFNRETGQLVLVNRWSADGNATRGGVGTEHGLSYVHDVDVVDDPRTGRPTAYVADWDRGMRVLDVTDPTNVEHVGQFDMNQSHESTAVPGLVEDADGNTRRVAVTSHEEPSNLFDQEESAIYGTPLENKTNPNSTGTVFIVDCDGIYPEDADADHLSEDDVRNDGEDALQVGELDNWTWRNADTDEDVDYEDVSFPSFSFFLSPHNQTVETHELQADGLAVEDRSDLGNERRWVLHQSFYNLGTRYLVIEPGSQRGLTGENRRDRRVDPHPNASRTEEIGWINNSTDWSLREIGHARPAIEPVIEGSGASPDFWCAVAQNGFTVCGDRGSGVHVTHHDAIPLEEPMPEVAAERSVEGGDTPGVVATSSLRVGVDVAVEDGSEVRVRDRIPAGYELIEADPGVRILPNGSGRFLEFERAAADGDTLSYVLEASDGVDEGALGPISVTPTDGVDHARAWNALGGTTWRSTDRL
jgi:hypothetical protein